MIDQTPAPTPAQNINAYTLKLVALLRLYAFTEFGDPMAACCHDAADEIERLHRCMDNIVNIATPNSGQYMRDPR
jgi:hypothetical protein